MHTSHILITKNTIAEWFEGLQANICLTLEETDRKAKFQEDLWQREGGGGGKTRIIQNGNGNILEKGGVAFSAVHGAVTDVMIQKLQMPAGDFFATGVSIVLHPANPMVSIIHMNVRYFEIAKDGVVQQQWFGGGIDLTPIYVNPAQAKWFHEQLKATCDNHDKNYYVKYKKWADDYFFIPHRQETRGIGGIFFDRIKPNDNTTLENLWAFVQDVGNTFAPTYTHLMKSNKDLHFGDTEKYWQALRRSRYVEFNLVYDAGTKFGLETNGRTESILMSMPPQAQWVYNYQPEADSKEAETLSYLKKGIDWVG